jgi:hypothetical protein
MFMNRKRVLPVALLAGVVALGLPALLLGSDHQDTPEVELNHLCDINDVYAFPSPTTAGNIVLVLTTASPIAGGVADSFDPDKLYQIKIDNNVSAANARDGIENLVLQFTFKGTGASQTVSMRGPVAPVSTGPNNKIVNVEPSVSGAVNTTLTSGNIKLYAGLKDDPFFLDLAQFFALVPDRRPATGPLSVVQTTPNPFCFRAAGVATDYLQGFNCLAIVVELPASMLTGAGNGKIGIWATNSR